MSMLSQQAKALRSWADQLAEREDEFGVVVRALVADLREAADTIESLRDRLQESYWKVPEQGEREGEGERESYDDGFSNGVKACLQQLDCLVHEGADVDEIQGWIDRQWEEEI